MPIKPPFTPITSPGQMLRICALVSLALPVQMAAASGEGSPFTLGPDLEDMGWAPGLTPDASVAALEEATAVQRGYFRVPGVSRSLDYLHGKLQDLDDATGVRIGTAYTMLFAHASGGPGDRYGGAGDFDLMTSWTAIGRGTPNTGRLVFDIEDRFEIGSQTPNALGRTIGTLNPVVNTFNDRGWVVRDAYWAQRLWDGQFRFLAGRADSTDYFGSHWMQSANNSFVNRIFSANAPIAGPGHGPTAGLSIRPNDFPFYVTGGAANAYGQTTEIGLNTLDEWTFFSFGEVGWTPTFEKFGRGRYTVSGWHIGERTLTGVPDDAGFSVVLDQELSKTIQVFARYGYADTAIINIRNYIQGGMGFRGLMGDPDDMAGVAFSYAEPRASDAREEKVLEGFYRWQLTAFSQVSLGAQAIFDPANTTEQDVIGVFWARFRIAF